MQPKIQENPCMTKEFQDMFTYPMPRIYSRKKLPTYKKMQSQKVKLV